MARFDLKKGDRFALKKSEGLNNLTVQLGWVIPAKYIGADDAPDPDVSAFLLGEDGTIMNDADFVYYNSESRVEPFSREKHGNKKAWRENVPPISADGSVQGALDDRGDGGDDNEAEGNEEMQVDLSKVNPKVTEIVFCATMYNDDKFTFGDVEGLYISITDDATGKELCRFDLKEKFAKETALAAGSLLCDEEGEWSFEALGKGFDGGMQTLIDIYA